ncbi:GDP-L-fucose synthase [Sphingobium sp. AN558]|uniref:GDP-L-fucose synthase family protein n=1 Tax=Sphingobium sp. AN558 TaxID=3133442 RepID=UPI0030BDD8B4
MSELSGKKILVTGASGVMGQALVEELRERNFTDVTAIASKEANLLKEQTVHDLFAHVKPDLVFHLAARVSGIMGNLRNRAAAFTDNARMNINVIDAAVQNGVTKFVAMGTTAIYSDTIALPMKEDDLWQGAPHGSEAPYGHAKRAMLAQLEACREHYGLQYAYCISTNLYGPHDKFDEQYGHVLPSLISKFHRAVTTGSQVEVWGTGAAQRDFLFAKDAAKALILSAESGEGPINVASGNPISIRETAETIADVVGYKQPIIWDETKPNGQMLRDYDITKLLGLGFKPQISFREGVRQTYNWYAENFPNVRR